MHWEQSRYIASILDSTHDAIVAIDLYGRITIFNEAAARLIGFPKEQAIGRDVRDVILNTRLLDVMATGQAELNQTQPLRDRAIVTNRMPVRGEKGEILGAVAVFRDMSEVQQLIEENTSLRSIRTLLEAVINSSYDAISVVDENGIMVMINPAYTRLTGLTAEEVLDQPATIDIAEGESIHLKVLETKEPVSGVFMKVGPQKREVVVHCAPIIVEGQLKGSVGVIHDVSSIRRLTEELERARRTIRRLETKYTFRDIIGESPSLQGAIAEAKEVSPTRATVLLLGESGTGKELFAHAIHHASPRKNQLFVRINCAALTESLLESELFGYVEGAFTGAKKTGRKGLFEEAQGGTLFLDEIGVIGLNLQAKLLRVLQEREIRRVGDSTPIPIDVRIIAATNADLKAMIKQGTFREDLYYRLTMAPIHIPALRERTIDIPLLARHLVMKYNMEYGRRAEVIAQEALDFLQANSWPGNVRELENVIGRAVLHMRYDETILQPRHLPHLIEPEKIEPEKPQFDSRLTGAADGRFDDGYQTWEEAQAAWEKSFLQQALAVSRGNKTETARRLNMSIRNLYYKLQRHGLD